MKGDVRSGSRSSVDPRPEFSQTIHVDCVGEEDLPSDLTPF